MLDVDSSSILTAKFIWLGLRVGCYLAIFCIQQMNRVNCCNGLVPMNDDSIIIIGLSIVIVSIVIIWSWLTTQCGKTIIIIIISSSSSSSSSTFFKCKISCIDWVYTCKCSPVPTLSTVPVRHSCQYDLWITKSGKIVIVNSKITGGSFSALAFCLQSVLCS